MSSLHSWLNFRIRGQFEIKILSVRHISTTYFLWILKKIILEPAIIWKLVTCQRITSKKYLALMGQHLSPRYGQVILVSGYPVSTAANGSQHWCPKCVHYQFSCASKLARKYQIEHWCPVLRTDGRCTVTWLPNFLGWVDFLSYGALLARSLLRGAKIMNKGIHYWAGINKYFKLNIDRVIFCASWHQRYN